MMRKTKIVCTLGPATDSDGVLREMLESGMNVARFNFSHGSHEEHKRRLDALKALRAELGLPVAAMLDTKGPEVRLRSFADGAVALKTGGEFTLTTRDVAGDERICSVTYADLPGDVKPGNTILLDDGLVRLTVLETTATDIRCRVENDGVMKNNKGVNVPGIRLSMPYMSQRDREDILFGVEQGFDFIAASFVRTAADVREIRRLLDEAGLLHPDHRQDRESGRRQQSHGDPLRGGRHHGGPGRHGRGDRLHGDPHHPEGHDRPVHGCRQARHHRHPDARLHGGEPSPHPGGDHRRGQRHLRRHLCHHALG